MRGRPGRQGHSGGRPHRRRRRATPARALLPAPHPPDFREEGGRRNNLARCYFTKVNTGGGVDPTDRSDGNGTCTAPPAQLGAALTWQQSVFRLCPCGPAPAGYGLAAGVMMVGVGVGVGMLFMMW